jgi:hypothetical protein
VQDRLIGVLNLYDWPDGMFGGWNGPNCDAFAAHAFIALASAQTYARNQNRIGELKARLPSPDDVVDQAHGVLMARESATLAEATNGCRSRMSISSRGGAVAVDLLEAHLSQHGSTGTCS